MQDCWLAEPMLGNASKHRPAVSRLLSVLTGLAFTLLWAFVPCLVPCTSTLAHGCPGPILRVRDSVITVASPSGPERRDALEAFNGAVRDGLREGLAPLVEGLRSKAARKNEEDGTAGADEGPDAASDDEDLQEIRRKRLEEMKAENKVKREQRLGSRVRGEYGLLSEKEFFYDVAKHNEYIIAHFSHPNMTFCRLMDKHLNELSTKYFGTRFVKLNAEQSPFLTTKFKIWCLPTLVLWKQGKAFHLVIGFEEFEYQDKASTEEVERVLLKHGVIQEGGYFSRSAT